MRLDIASAAETRIKMGAYQRIENSAIATGSGTLGSEVEGKYRSRPDLATRG